jgi:hypothetical protein
VEESKLRVLGFTEVKKQHNSMGFTLLTELFAIRLNHIRTVPAIS